MREQRRDRGLGSRKVQTEEERPTSGNRSRIENENRFLDKGQVVRRVGIVEGLGGRMGDTCTDWDTEVRSDGRLLGLLTESGGRRSV